MLKKQIVSFVATGSINTIFGYSIYALLIFVGLNYFYAVLFATIIGIIFNFKTIGHYVFASSSNKLFLRFTLVYAIVYVINVGLIYILSLWNLNYYTAGFIALFPCAVVSFILNKYFVFHGQELYIKSEEK